jgi:hypothetical protein
LRFQKESTKNCTKNPINTLREAKSLDTTIFFVADLLERAVPTNTNKYLGHG